MAPGLEILCEGGNDEMFYLCLLERISGLRFELTREFRYRPGDNWKTVRATARLLCNRYAHFTAMQALAVVIALDNDRAPGHPAGRSYPRPLPVQDQKKQSRYLEIKSLISARLGEEPAERKVQTAIAIPVEMIESWLLLLLDPTLAEEDLPPFSEAKPNGIAAEYYNGSPPPQLKDLRDSEARHRGQDLDSLFLDAAASGNLASLAARSKSFRLFQDDVLEWERGLCE